MSELIASEALFGFVGWLTTREDVTQMSARHDCAGLADLIEEFCKTNGLADPVDGWHHNLVHPT